MKGKIDMEKEALEWRWCLVGNIIDKRIYGENHEIRYGVKVFSPGTKVYIAPHQWGDGGERLVVIGVPRGKKRLVECVIDSEYIYNFRIKKVYPTSGALKKMNKSKYEWYGNDDEWKDFIINYARIANDYNRKNSKGIIESKESFLLNLDKINIADKGKERIKNNLNLENEDIVEFCKKIISDKNCNIYRERKNWCCELNDIIIKINVFSYIITSAHIKNK